MSDLSFSLLPSPWTGRGRLIALAASVAVHIVLLPAALSYAVGAARPFPHYRIQLLQLQARPSPPLPNQALVFRGQASSSNSRWHSIQLPFLKPLAPQTLLVPDAPPEIALKQAILAPVALAWNAVTPPPPDLPVRADETKPIPAQNVSASPSLSRPNNEQHVADLEIARAPASLPPSLPVVSATTVPFQIEGAEAGHQMPETASPAANDVPTTNIISVPAAALLAKDTVIVPKVSQAAASQPPGMPTGDSNSPAGAGSNASAGNAPRDVVNSEPGALTRIDQPRDGKFSVSVLGASVADQYPERSDLMRGRVVSTVYLNVGLKKSWILEYSAAAAQSAPQTGSTATPEAPWAFLMLRPNVSIPPEADAILVHSLLTVEGKFDEMSVVLPSEWAQKDTLLNALRQWRFRPATKNGQPVAVEVLLIVPRQPEDEE
jgi:hypothetical protein